METISISKLGPDCDAVILARKVILQQLERIEAKKMILHVPRPTGLMKVVPGHHFHHTPELFIQFSGYTAFNFPAERIRVLPGEICLLPRGLPHKEVVGPWKGPFYNLVFMSDNQQGLFFHLAHETKGKFPHGLVGQHMPWPDMQHAVHHLDEVVAWYHGDDKMKPWAIRGLLMAHFASLLRVLESQSQQTQESFKIVRARQLASTRLSDQDLSVTRIAEWLQCNPDYLSHLFHKETGISLTRHINQQRMNQAKHLLETTPLSIKEIAHAVGYSEAGYFARVFFQSIGTTPTRFRTTLRLK
jgi:AraC-like DNA-binding protein/aromatic ring-cleaving dioxygenase